jgi:hypothetical protein
MSVKEGSFQVVRVFRARQERSTKSDETERTTRILLRVFRVSLSLTDPATFFGTGSCGARSLPLRFCNYAAFNSTQHAAHRVALIGMAVRQKGQSFFAGSVFLSLFTIFISTKTTRATITKLTMSLMKAP